MKCAIGIGMLALTLFLGGSGSLTHADEALDWYQKGNQLSDQGRFEEAADAYHRAIQANPDSTGPWFNLGLAYKNLRQYDRAAASLERALELEPENIFIRLRLGNIYNLMEKWGKAIEHLNYVVHNLPGNAEAHGNLGWAYLNYHSGPAFKMLVILNLDKAVALFEKQGMPEAAEATRKTLQAARKKFSYPAP